MTTPTSPKKSALAPILLGAIVILLGIIVIRPMINGGGDAKTTKTKPIEGGKSTPVADVAGPVDEEMKPTKVDNTKMQQTYQVGKSYRSIVQVSLTSTGTNEDWGVVADSSFAYVGEVVMDRTIQSNDGTNVVFLQEFPEAKTMTAVTQIEGIRIELPLAGQFMLEGLGHLAALGWTGTTLEPGWSTVATGSANTVLENPLAKKLIADATRDPDAQIFRYIDSIESKKMKVDFVNGEGVRSIEPIGADLTGEEVDFVMLMNYSSDATVLPDDSEPGSQWTIRGADLMAILDPSANATPTGTVTAQRLEDITVGTRTVAQIQIMKGVLNLSSTTDKDESNGTWTPRGVLTYDFTDKIITGGELEGDLVIENRSTDHLIFEASWSQKPKYKVVYHCEIK